MSGVSVAVVGGGVAGLTCAARLGQLGIHHVTVFDTGKHEVGGRCSSRTVNVRGQMLTFDHAVQYFTVSDSRFQKMVDYLERGGHVRRWAGAVGTLRGGRFTADPKLAQRAYIGTEGARSIAQGLASLCRVRRPCWVATLAHDPHTRGWQVDKFGSFDYVVIAHNGKCAAKLTERAGCPEIHQLCQTRFASRPNPRDCRMTLCSLFVLVVAFEKPLGLKFEGAHVNDQNLSWVANNTAKLKKDNNNSATASVNSFECWTIISTKTLAEKNKVPQEHIPPAVDSRITNLMLESFRRVTGLATPLPAQAFTKLQLWGAAVPVNTWAGGAKSIFDAQRQICIASDWVASPCLQGAALSGLDAADRVAAHAKGEKSSTKLHPSFKDNTTDSPLGAFP